MRKMRIPMPKGSKDWRSRMELGSVLACVLLVGGILAEVTQSRGLAQDFAMAAATPADRAQTDHDKEAIDESLRLIEKRRLFKPAAPLPMRSMARESVGRILAQLSLNGIVQRDGELRAYINVKGLGMRAFPVGEGVQDLFAVVAIGERSVQLDIAGERVELSW